MRLANPSARLIAALLLLIWVAPEARAQVKQPAKTAQKRKAPRAAARPTTAKRPAPVSQRDPFEPLVSARRSSEEPGVPLPPGKAGLVIGSLRVEGIVRAPSGMIVVVSNPQLRVYFLREGDQVYNGRVERITMEGVSFRETSKDSFGKTAERQVTKALYPSPGEK